MHVDPYSHIMIKTALNVKYAFDAMLFSIDSYYWIYTNYYNKLTNIFKSISK